MTTILVKYVAHAGVCSRRAAVDLIKAGTVSVNKTVITDPSYQVPADAVVMCHNKIITPKQLVYIVLNKPKGFVTTRSDEQGRQTIMDLILDKSLKKILYPVGRLDCNTTGVLLLTNDGELAYTLSHPKFEIEKVYTAVLDQPLDAKDAVALKQGVKLKDGLVKVDHLVTFAKNTVARVTLHSGKYRIIRRLFLALGYQVKKLDRTEFAGISKRGMPSGAYRFLKPIEIKKLKTYCNS